MKNTIILLLLLFMAAPSIGISQDQPKVLEYEVNRVYPFLPITKKQVSEAQTLEDLNERYKPSWVRKYYSVEILANVEGQPKKAIGTNDQLSPEQKDLLMAADEDQEVMAKIDYLPQNKLTQNDPKLVDFKLTFIPEKEATYIGGQEQLNQYLKEKIIEFIPKEVLTGYAMAAVKFVINEEGEVEKPKLLWTSDDEKVDELLMEAVRKMPCWKPAEYTNGDKVEQESVLMVGNMESCVVNTLSVRRD